MSKFNKGEIVKVIGRSYEHCFPLGSYVRVIDPCFNIVDGQVDMLAEELLPSGEDDSLISQIVAEDCLEKADSLVDRLKIRAIIRRQAQDRKSVQEGKKDRLADLLDEAADYISELESENVGLISQIVDERY
jgi:hypothetical protein